jgi:ABC-type branched-subunit amino acid transport system ATPase component
MSSTMRESAAPPGNMANSAANLTVRGLNASYGEAKVLFDIDLDVAPGQIVACVGRNGAGKTTLLRAISGFLKPNSGSVRAGALDLVGMKPYDVAKRGVKYVPQDKKVFYDLTVRENLELGSYATGDNDWSQALAYFPKLKVHMDRKAGMMSGGERQMLMIARAILGSPDFLLIDEPTEGLAPGIVNHLRLVFAELAKKSGLIIVEQNLPLVCAIADKVYAMRDGRIVAEIADKDAMTFDMFEQFL